MSEDTPSYELATQPIDISSLLADEQYGTAQL